jgi:hypothetical protein
MNPSEIKKVARLLEYEDDCRLARKEFMEHGVRFYDKFGTGHIVDGVKKYTEKF